MVRGNDKSLRASSLCVLVCCLTAFVLLVAGSGASVRGADDRPVLAHLSIEVVPEVPTWVICVGETRELLVRGVLTVVEKAPPFVGEISPVGELTWKATNSNTALATLQRKDPIVKNYGVAEAYRGERFDLIGLKPGTGTLTFRASMDHMAGKPRATPKNVSYQVRACDYKVSMLHVISFLGKVGLTAAADVRVVADDAGQLSGTGQVDWTPITTDRICVHRYSVPASPIDITGAVADDGTLTLRFAYEATRYSEVVPTCSRPNYLTGYARFPVQPPTISPTFSADGGSIQLRRKLPKPLHWGLDETVVITVEPIREAAIATVGRTTQTHVRATART